MLYVAGGDPDLDGPGRVAGAAPRLVHLGATGPRARLSGPSARPSSGWPPRSSRRPWPSPSSSELLALRARDTETIARLQAGRRRDRRGQGHRRRRDGRAAPADWPSWRRSWPTRRRSGPRPSSGADAAEDILEEHEGWGARRRDPGHGGGPPAARQAGHHGRPQDGSRAWAPRSRRCSMASASPPWAQLAASTPDRLRRPRRRRPGVQRARPDDVAPTGQLSPSAATGRR